MTDDGDGDTVELTEAALTVVGATRGEREVEIGPPSDRPDYAELTVRRDDARLVLSVDVTAGDLGTGHADVTLTPEEAETLADTLYDLSESR